MSSPVTKITKVDKSLKIAGSSECVRSKAVLPTSLMSLLNQLPPIPRFSVEEQLDRETFQDWLEQFQSWWMG